MPERFLLQILRHLVTHGILHSTRGVDGGYNLERSADEISLLELIEAIDGPLHSALPAGDGAPLQYDAKLREAMESITETARQQLAAIKLSDLLSPPETAEPNQSAATEGSRTSGEGGTTHRIDPGMADKNLRSEDWPAPVSHPNRGHSAGGHNPYGGNGSGSASSSDFREHRPQ
jgi:Rrf2 family protein